MRSEGERPFRKSRNVPIGTKGLYGRGETKTVPGLQKTKGRRGKRPSEDRTKREEGLVLPRLAWPGVTAHVGSK